MKRMAANTEVSSRVSAVTIVAVALTFWLPYLTFFTGTPLVNPLWAALFGTVPALLEPGFSSSATFFAALIWPLIVTLLIALILMSTASRASKLAHVAVWLSMAIIIPASTADTSEIYRSVSVYRFLSM